MRNRHEDNWDKTIQPLACLKNGNNFIGKSGQNFKGNFGYFSIITTESAKVYSDPAYLFNQQLFLIIDLTSN